MRTVAVHLGLFVGQATVWPIPVWKGWLHFKLNVTGVVQARARLHLSGFRFCALGSLNLSLLIRAKPVQQPSAVMRQVSQKIFTLWWTPLSLVLVFCLPFAWLHK